MTTLEVGKIATISYTKESGEAGNRDILPVYVPTTNVKAIDVTNIPVEDREELLHLYEEYREYVEGCRARTFNFETWAEHSHGLYLTPKWRTFKVSGITDTKRG